MSSSIRSISIALCSFNGARFLDAQLRSLAGQAGVEEIVVVDDGSTDATQEILARHAAADSRLRIFVNATRLGVVRNFEKAIRLARCPWVALSDQDDVWRPDKLARMRAAWDGAAVLLHHATHKFCGEIPTTLRTPAGERRKFAGAEVRRLLYRNSIVGHTTLVRADVVERLMPFPRDVPHDWWIGVGAALHGPVQYVDEYLVHYRIHETNAYHRAGSRLTRLRSEHELRMNLLDELRRRPEVPEPVRGFVREYREQLAAAEVRGFSWPLWRFYRRHAALVFGGPGQRLSWFRRTRKSLAATCGALGQGRAGTRGFVWADARSWLPAYSLRHFSRVGLMAFAAVMLASTGGRDSRVATDVAAHRAADGPMRGAGTEDGPGHRWLRFRSEKNRPPFFLARHVGWFGPREPGAFRPSGPPPFGGPPRFAGNSPLKSWRAPDAGVWTSGPRHFRRERPRMFAASEGGPGGRPFFPAMLLRGPPLGGFGPPPVFFWRFRPDGMRPGEFEPRQPRDRSGAEGPGGFGEGAA